MDQQLGQLLRSWRDRCDPASAGIVRTGVRRTPGLRREEVASLAGISVNYLTRLEQGRATHPSRSVVASLSRTLSLNEAETAYLYRVTGHDDSGALVPARTMTPAVERIMNRLDDVPAIVIDPAWTVVAANRMARALIADDIVGQNCARNQFVGPVWIRRDPEDEATFEREIASDLRLKMARFPDDVELGSIVSELRDASARFASLWATPPTGPITAARKTLHHPIVGRITFDCDALEVLGSNLRIVVWSAQPNSADAALLSRLAAL